MYPEQMLLEHISRDFSPRNTSHQNRLRLLDNSHKTHPKHSIGEGILCHHTGNPFACPALYPGTQHRQDTEDMLKDPKWGRKSLWRTGRTGDDQPPLSESLADMACTCSSPRRCTPPRHHTPDTPEARPKNCTNGTPMDTAPACTPRHLGPMSSWPPPARRCCSRSTQDQADTAGMSPSDSGCTGSAASRPYTAGRRG